MSDLLQHLAAQALDRPLGLQPRVRSMFEPDSFELMSPSPNEPNEMTEIEAPLAGDVRLPAAAAMTQQPTAAARSEAQVDAQPSRAPEPSVEPLAVVAPPRTLEPSRAAVLTPSRVHEAPLPPRVAVTAVAPSLERSARGEETAHGVLPPMAAGERRRRDEFDVSLLATAAHVRSSASSSSALQTRSQRVREPSALAETHNPACVERRVEATPAARAPADPRAALSSSPAAPEPTTVAISIGRIEVRAHTSASVSSSVPRVRATPVMTLDTYMRKRRQGEL